MKMEVKNVVLDLILVKEAPSVYAAYCSRIEGEPSYHDSLQEALLHVAEFIPEEVAKFVNVAYCGCRLETAAICQLPSNAEVMASRLVALVAEVHQTS